MSDIDSDSQKPKQSNKLGIQENEIENNNIFSFKERSHRGSDSQQQHLDYRKSESSHNQQSGKQHNQKDEEKQQDEDHKANKLSDIVNDVDVEKQDEEGKNIEQSNEKQKKDEEQQRQEILIKVQGEPINTQKGPEKAQKQQEQNQNKQEVKTQENAEQKKQQKQELNEQKETVQENKQQKPKPETQQTQKIEKEIQKHQQGQQNKQVITLQQKIQPNTTIQPVEKTQISQPEQEVKSVKKQDQEEKITKQTDNIDEIKQQEPIKLLEQTKKTQAIQIIQEKPVQVTNIISPTKLQIKDPIKQQKPIQKVQQSQKTSPSKPSQQPTQQKDTIKQQQQKYKNELDQDMSALKNTLIKKKKSDKTKQSDKNKLNKTLVPAVLSSPRQLQFQQTAQVRAMQLNMITKMAQEKKKQNYQRLKQWDKRRAQSLAIHRNMIQILQNQIDKRIKSSIQNLQIYTTFLKQKARQQQKYIAHPVINTKYALQHNTISKNVYINCTVILNALSDQNNIRCRKIGDFIHLIRNDILRDSVDVHLSQSQRQLLKVRQKISNLKAALRKYNAQTQQKTSQLSLFFNQNAVNMAIDGQRDFYLTQIQFLQKASQQTSVQKKLGQHCLQYLYCAINQQIKRSKVIRDAMITFTKALQQCYSIQPDAAQIQQLSKAQQNKLIQQFYSLEEIFDERCLTVYKTHQNMDNSKMLTVENFAQFLNKFQFEGFDCRVVLLKQYQVKYHPSSKNETNKQQNCYLVITVDKFIHLFLSKEKTDVYARPDVTIKATMKNLELKAVKNQILDIVIKDEKRNSMISYFWETKNDRVYRIEFTKRDARQEFMDYIRKLRG